MNDQVEQCEATILFHDADGTRLRIHVTGLRIDKGAVVLTGTALYSNRLLNKLFNDFIGPHGPVDLSTQIEARDAEAKQAAKPTSSPPPWCDQPKWLKHPLTGTMLPLVGIEPVYLLRSGSDRWVEGLWAQGNAPDEGGSFHEPYGPALTDVVGWLPRQVIPNDETRRDNHE